MKFETEEEVCVAALVCTYTYMRARARFAARIQQQVLSLTAASDLP